ncbi:MAG: type VII secretion protein EccCa [Corynebacterium sp.]|uniref:type VII secretion protein EccCa n=1 Tax=Corynebacterium sp. TaxID=1720 RepID=UPI0026DD8082|nr:type VII secretion protein EccCa [Corynebacterium sp.]MDO4762468.1 type VII secretion protein EccCa [Corynebacterium sp.]
MSTKIVHRPARLHAIISKQEPLRVAEVPTIRQRGQQANVITLLMPLVAGGGMVLMMFSSGNPIRMAIGCVMFVAVIFMAVGMFIRARTGSRKIAEQERERFLEHLAELEGEIRQLAVRQRREALSRHPQPAALTDVVRDPYRLWERRKGDEDFLIVRIGSGRGELARGVHVPPLSNPMLVPEPIAKAHLDRMLSRTLTIEQLPIAIPVRGCVSLVGDEQVCAQGVRALLSQIAVFHAPDDVRIHCALPLADSRIDADTPPESMFHALGLDARWALWFPHLLSEDLFDGPIGRRLVSYDEESAEVLLHQIDARAEALKERSRFKTTALDVPYLVIVVNMDSEHGRMIAQRLDTVSSLDAARLSVIATSSVQYNEPTRVDVRVLCEADGRIAVQLLDRGEVRTPTTGADGYVERLLYGGSTGTMDQVSPLLAETVARAVSPLRLHEDASPDAPLEQTIGLDTMLGVENFATFSIQEAWQPRAQADFLNVPFGLGADNEPISLDIKESAKQGMGPHGLCVGATGSGKSEVLRTLVLSQVICHSPEDLSLVLVDFKGGATFAGLEPLPHTAAIVDNLEDAQGLVDRLHDSILGEIQRRQRVLQAAGNLANVGEYAALRAEGKVTEPLPVLFVIIDEFGELLAAKPEFIELFVQIGRIGRSIGVHLLLATQRLEEGRLRGLESYLSYRIGLRTFSAQESRAALGCTDAHDLPPIPGSGFLKVDPDIFLRFKAAYVSGPYESAERAGQRELPPVPMPLELANTTEAWLQQRKSQHAAAMDARRASTVAQPTTLDLVVSRLAQAAPKTRQIWLPPLPTSIRVDQVLGAVTESSQQGLSAPSSGHMRISMGLKDQPLKQWQGPLLIDLSGTGGNMAILGAPQTGKTTALCTLITSAALTHRPSELNFYIIDMAGSTLNYLEELPHVGTVATRFDEDKLRRTIAEVGMFLKHREEIFNTYQIASVEQMRTMHAQHALPELACADLVLAVDGWSTLRKDYEELADAVTEIAQRGLSFGVHVIFLSGRWADFRLPLQAVIGTKLEFALNDPIDSAIGRKPAAALKEQPTGRALDADGLYSHIAQPTITTLSPQETVGAIANAWNGATAPPVRMLPAHITLDTIRNNHPQLTPADIVLGLRETTLSPAIMKTEEEHRHTIIIGDAKSGKTSCLRALAQQIIAGKKPGEVMFGIWDLKRGLLGTIPDPFIGGYAGTVPGCETLAKGIAAELERRLPGPSITIEQLRTRTWWQGPEIYLLIDNIDMMEGSANPLKLLTKYFHQAADIGLHVIVTRRSTGMAKAGYDPVMQTLREAGATSILLSGDRQEGSIYPKVFLKPLPPGRAQWVDRSGRVEMVQIGYLADEHTYTGVLSPTTSGKT